MASDTTSILDLPTDPAGGGSIGGNVSFSANEKINTNVNVGLPSSALTLDQTTINQIVSGLQQASTTGATQLPSRDIPRNIDGVTQDVQVQPNYIPQTSNKDYINDYENNADIINNYNRNAEYGNSLDQLYDELQIPLLISVLYFLFQLPVFKRYLYKFFPALFSKDGNHNIYGFLFTSVLFGLLYYLLAKITTHFSRF
jgi:hypothetical protein